MISSVTMTRRRIKPTEVDDEGGVPPSAGFTGWGVAPFFVPPLFALPFVPPSSRLDLFVPLPSYSHSNA